MRDIATPSVLSKILLSEKEIVTARAALRARGLSFVKAELFRKLQRRRLIPGVSIGDNIKSWDILSVLDFLKSDSSVHARILDIGCYASEILPALRSLGFRNLTGVDLNPDVNRMPFSGDISYHVADFMKTAFSDASFDVITAISVIEHGYDGEKLFAEAGRLLDKRGLFIATFDFWPEKRDTSKTRLFDMSWTIFSDTDVREMVACAARHGFEPVGTTGQMPVEPVIHNAGQHYTFAMLTLRKL